MSFYEKVELIRMDPKYKKEDPVSEAILCIPILA